MILPGVVITHLSYQYLTTGRVPQGLQGDATLYRTGNYVYQHHANANPDNFWDGRFFCWTSDPTCGLDIGPKRPWEDLKDPKANLAKLNRDASVNSRRDQVGYGGF